MAPKKRNTQQNQTPEPVNEETRTLNYNELLQRDILERERLQRERAGLPPAPRRIITHFNGNVEYQVRRENMQRIEDEIRREMEEETIAEGIPVNNDYTPIRNIPRLTAHISTSREIREGDIEIVLEYNSIRFGTLDISSIFRAFGVRVVNRENHP